MTAAASYGSVAQELYVAYFGRPADYAGLQNFEAALAAAHAPTDIVGLQAAYSTNPAIKALIDNLSASGESAALYAACDSSQFVDSVYGNLFGHAANPVELAFCSNAIASGQMSMGDAALFIAADAQSNTSAQGLNDANTVANKVAVATDFTADLNTSASMLAYRGASAVATARALLASVAESTVPLAYQAVVQQTVTAITHGATGNIFNLTAGADNVVGTFGNNTFVAILNNNAFPIAGQAATLNAPDTITGGTQLNTLDITDFGTDGSMAIPSSAAITGITTLNINTSEGIGEGPTTQDLGKWLGLVAVNVTHSFGTDNLTVGAAALSIVDAGGNVATNGGSTVSVTDGGGPAGSGAITINGGPATTAVSITGGAGASITDSGGAGTNTIAGVYLTATGGNTMIVGTALAALSVTDNAQNVTVTGGNGALRLSLSGDTAGVIADSTTTALQVLTATTASKGITLIADDAATITFNDAADLTLTGLSAAAATAVTISGSGAFSADLSDLNHATAINATAATGVLTVGLGANESFIGGAGQAIVSIGPNQTGAIVAGSALNNEIIVNNFGATTTAAVPQAGHFSILGMAGNTSGTFDMSQFSGYTTLDVRGSGDDVTFTNVAAGSSLRIDAGNTHVITLQTVEPADLAAPIDSATVSLGTANTTGIAVAGITLENSLFSGVGTVNLASNGAAAIDTNTLGTLIDANVSILNVSGTASLSVATAIADSKASFIIDNASTATVASSLNIADDALTTLTFAGSGLTTVTLLDGGASLTVIDSDTATVSVGLVAPALTSLTLANNVPHAAATFAAGSIAGASLATLALNGDVAFWVYADAVSTGITVSGATDNAVVSFTSNGLTVAGKTDSVALGNGNDSVIFGALSAAATLTTPSSIHTIALGTGNDTVADNTLGKTTISVVGSSAGTESIHADYAASATITAGNGANTISANGASAVLAITAGNGDNTITANGTIGTGTGGDTGSIRVGSGANTIITGASGALSITLGTHTGIDTIAVGANAGTSAFTTITGIAAHDVIDFADAASGAAIAITAAQVKADAAATATGGSTTNLLNWVTTALDITAQHQVAWFNFQGNTYLVEQSAPSGAHTLIGDTVVKLTGIHTETTAATIGHLLTVV